MAILNSRSLKRLKLLGLLTKQKRDLAAQEVAKCNKYLAQERLRLQQLYSFQDDYAKEFTTKCTLESHTNKLSILNSFYDNIGIMIDKAQADLVAIQQQLDNKIAIWHQIFARYAALEKYIHSIEQQIIDNEIYLEQKELDAQINDYYDYFITGKED